LGHDLAIDADAPGGDQFFGGAARGDPSSGENALESFHGGGVALGRRQPLAG
jgi:hypothetical protein